MTAIALVATGQTISHTTGRHTTTLTRQEQVFRLEVRTGVTVGHGGHVVEELTASFTTEQAARLASRTIAETFKAGGTVQEAQDATYTALRTEWAEQSRRRGGYANPTLLADLERAVDIFDPQKAEMDELAADIRNNLTGPVRSFRDIRDEHAAATQRDRGAA